MLSSYRLGDLVLLGLFDNDEKAKKEILANYPNSIGSEFILEKQKRKFDRNLDIITEIVKKHMIKNSHLLPTDIENSTVIHLRLGDVVGGNNWYEQNKRPLEIDVIKNLLHNDNNKKYIIGKCHFSSVSSNNYEECTNLSNEYLDNAIKSLNATHFDSGNHDTDLYCAVKAKVFLRGKGFFGRLIYEIRKIMNKENIETGIIDY
jgi:hypothetical protein